MGFFFARFTFGFAQLWRDLLCMLGMWHFQIHLGEFFVDQFAPQIFGLTFLWVPGGTRHLFIFLMLYLILVPFCSFLLPHFLFD